MKLKKIPRPSKLFTGMVLVPFTIILGYYAFVAEPRYVAETRVTVKREEASGGNAELTDLLGTTGTDKEDELLLADRVASGEVALAIDKQEGLRKSWSSSEGSDFIYRIPQFRSDNEDFIDIWRQKVTAQLDPYSGALVLKVATFNPNQSRQVAQDIVKDLDRFTNEMGQKLSREQVDFARSEVDRLQHELTVATGKVVDFQTKNKVLDPQGDADQDTQMFGKLAEDLAKSEAETTAARAYLTPDSPQLKGLEQKAAAMRSQLDTEHARVTRGSQRLGPALAEFAELKLDADLAGRRYKTAQTALETAQVNAVKRSKTLVLIDSPRLADKAYYPRYGYEILAALAGLLALFAIVRMTNATLREHRQ